MILIIATDGCLNSVITAFQIHTLVPNVNLIGLPARIIEF